MEREFEKHLLFETKSNNQIRYGCFGETSLSEYYIYNQGLLPDTLISSSSVSLLGHGIRCHKHACHGGSLKGLGQKLTHLHISSGPILPIRKQKWSDVPVYMTSKSQRRKG